MDNNPQNDQSTPESNANLAPDLAATAMPEPTQSQPISATGSDLQQPFSQSAPVIEPQSITDTVNPSLSQNLSSLTTPRQKKSKKLIVIAIIILLVTVGATAFFMLNGGKSSIATDDLYKPDALNKIFDPDNPIKIKKDNKYGLISTDGKILIEPKYDKLSDFIGNYAIADSKYIIDKTGKTELTSKNSYSIDPLRNGYWVVDHRIYDDKLKLVTPDTMLVENISGYDDFKYMKYNDETNKTLGFIDICGKVTYALKKTDIFDDYHLSYKSSSLPMKNDYGVVVALKDGDDYEVLSGTSSIINLRTGRVVLELKYEKGKKDNKVIQSNDHGNNIFEIYSVPESEDDDPLCEYSVYIADDKIAYQADSPAKISGIDNLADQILEIEYTNDNNKTWYDIKNKKMLTEEPSYKAVNLSEFELLTGYSRYENDNKYGIMKGETVILKSEYDTISYLPLNTYKYLEQKLGKQIIIIGNVDSKHRNYSLYDLKSNKKVFDFETPSAGFIGSSSLFMHYYSNDNKSMNVYNLLTGESINLEITSRGSVYLNSYSNYFTYWQGSDTKVQIYNSDMKLIYEQEKL